MNTFEKCKIIRDLLASNMGLMLLYSANWELIKTNIDGTIRMWEEERGSWRINLTDLTLAEMMELNFGIWDEEDEGRLIPVWLSYFISGDFEVTSINGDTILSCDMNHDNRFGFLGYKVKPKEFIFLK